MVLSLESTYLLENSHVYHFRNTLAGFKKSNYFNTAKVFEPSPVCLRSLTYVLQAVFLKTDISVLHLGKRSEH